MKGQIAKKLGYEIMDRQLAIIQVIYAAPTKSRVKRKVLIIPWPIIVIHRLRELLTKIHPKKKPNEALAKTPTGPSAK